jgi:hypothetical protein
VVRRPESLIRHRTSVAEVQRADRVDLRLGRANQVMVESRRGRAHGSKGHGGRRGPCLVAIMRRCTRRRATERSSDLRDERHRGRLSRRSEVSRPGRRPPWVRPLHREVLGRRGRSSDEPSGGALGPCRGRAGRLERWGFSRHDGRPGKVRGPRRGSRNHGCHGARPCPGNAIRGYGARSGAAPIGGSEHARFIRVRPSATGGASAT